MLYGYIRISRVALWRSLDRRTFPLQGLELYLSPTDQASLKKEDSQMKKHLGRIFRITLGTLAVLIGALIVLPTSIANAGSYNSNTNWLRDAHYGLFVQWLYQDNDLTGDWNTLVNGFNVNNFANQAKQLNATYVIFTIGQCHKEWASPNTTADNLYIAAGLSA